MNMSLLIIEQILEMFCMIAVGFVLVRTKTLKKDTAEHLSKIALNVVLPCVIINTFQISYQEEVLQGLVFAFALAILFNLILIFVPHALKKPFNLSVVEQASLSYPNSGEILVPLVVSILSKEMRIYCCAFLIVQICLIFTHGEMLISKDTRLHLNKMIRNKNVIAILVALCIFIFQIPLPTVLTNVLDSFSGMLSPACMLAIGMSIGDCKLKEIFADKRNYLICFLRLLVLPLFVLFLIKISPIDTIMKQAKDIAFIVFLATASSTSSTITNMALCYKVDVERASSINIMSVLFLILTLPLMAILYYS